MFAVFEAKGFQYLGSPGEKLKVPRLDSNVGEKVTFDKVLLVKNGDTKIGQPYIKGASITAKIVDHGRYRKIIVFKFKKRKRYKRTKGHRQTYTEIEIKDIVLGGKMTTKKESRKEMEKAKKDTAAKVEAKETKAKTKKTAAKEAKKVKATTAKKKTSSKATTKVKKKASEPKKKVKKTVKKKETTAKKKSPLKSKKASDKAKKKASDKAKKTKKSTGTLKKKAK
jgi:large subunit ribosomal protein L21